MINKFKNGKIGIRTDNCNDNDIHRLAIVLKENISILNDEYGKSILEWLYETINEKWKIILFECNNLNAYRGETASLYAEDHEIVTMREFIDAVEGKSSSVEIKDDEFMSVFFN